MKQSIINLDLVKIGNINNIDVNNNIISVKLYYDINIEDIKFIFLNIYEEHIPFKILKFEENNNKLNFTIKDIDLIKNFKTVRLKVYIEKEIFNNIIDDKENVNIINFEVFDKNNTYCGYISNVFDYPGNRCLEICKDNLKKLLPYIDNYVKIVDIKNNKIFINSIHDLT